MYLHLTSLLLLFAVTATAADKPFRAGAFAMEITPTKFPISVNGNMTDHQAMKASDPLHAHCLVLDDGKTKLALAICDSCMIPRELIDAAKTLASKKTGIPASHMLVAATHAHSCPTVAGIFQSEPDKDYVEYLTKKIAEGIEKANANLVPAKIGWAVGKDAKQLYNRRWLLKPGAIFKDPFDGTTDRVRMNPGYLNPDIDKPAGPVDPEVPIVSIQTREGKPLALLANYSLHYVGGVTPLSADYFGMFADTITRKLDAGKSPFVGILTNGTSGDVNNVNFGMGAPGPFAPFDRARIVAESVASAAHAAYKNVEHTDELTLAVAEKEIELGVRKPNEKDLERAKGILADVKNPVLSGTRQIYARETVLMAKYPDTVKMKLQAMRIGDLGIVAIPCEVFTEIGLHLKKTSPLKPTFTIELANGYNGYLPTPEQHKLGGYETWRARSSNLEVEASTKVVATVTDLLNRVAKEK